MSHGASGLWTYRSYRNDQELISRDPQKAARNIFGEGIFDLRESDAEVSGTFDMGGGYVLDVSGRWEEPGGQLALVGTGRENTPTAGWEYDYRAVEAYAWPSGVAQVPSLVGSVIRAKPHGGSPAGYVASFIAVRHA